MMRKVVSLAVILSTTLAYADPRHIMVLKTDGTADAPTRAKVDAAVLKLARTLDGQVSPGDISFDDATAMVGCKPETQSCKDDVLATLAVDEVVMTTATRKPGTLEVTVHRIAKGTTHDATVRRCSARRPRRPPTSRPHRPRRRRRSISPSISRLRSISLHRPPISPSCRSRSQRSRWSSTSSTTGSSTPA